MHDADGMLERAGERWRLRFTRRLAHPPERVWRSLTEPGRLAASFPGRLIGDLTIVGAPLRFEHEAGAYEPFDGEVLACVPPQLLEFRWGPDTIRFEVAPAGEGSTLTLIDTFAQLGKAARDGAGWHVCLERLEQALGGDTAPVAVAARRRQVDPDYIDRFGPEGSTLGPPQPGFSAAG